jgi:hypothetical protein
MRSSGGRSKIGFDSEILQYREAGMKRFTFPFLGLLLATGLSVAALALPAAQTFVGSIGDSMCGAKHMSGSDKDCTLGCIKEGAKYILVDPSGKVYQLSDQKKPQAFAGAKVKVTGTLSGDTITVTSIAAAN